MPAGGIFGIHFRLPGLPMQDNFMRRRISFGASALAGAGVLLLLMNACSGGDATTEPKPGETGPAAAVQIVSGGGQSGTVGRELAQPIVAKVSDARGRAV